MKSDYRTMDISYLSEKLGNKNSGQVKVKFKYVNETLLGLGRAVGATSRERSEWNCSHQCV